MKIVKIELDDYDYQCADGCCTHYGTITKVNGKELSSHNQDKATIIKGILEELEFEVEVQELYNGKLI